jgi:MFS family permease
LQVIDVNAPSGLEGWRWIFIIEGLATVAMAFLCYFCLVDSPASSSRWLTPEEIRYLELRQISRRVTNTEEYREKGIDWHNLVEVLKDWKIVALIFANWSQSVPNYALKFTMPTIIKNMGFTSANAQLLTIPPYALGAIAAYVFARFADKFTWRMPFIMIPQLTLIPAFAILFAYSPKIKENIPLCYFAVCLACFG